MEEYIKKKLYLEIDFSKSKNIAKRLINFFDLNNNNNKIIYLEIQNYKSWKEAKAT
jgi:hypothetical protein